MQEEEEEEGEEAATTLIIQQAEEEGGEVEIAADSVELDRHHNGDISMVYLYVMPAI